MKKTNFKSLLMVIFLTGFFTASLFAQPNPKDKGKQPGKEQVKEKECPKDKGCCKEEKGCCMLAMLKLTDEQKTKVEDLKLNHLKEVTPIKNQIKEKQAHINTLMVADKPDMQAINQTVDEISNLGAQLLKKKIAFMQDIRALLTDKQKIEFDSKLNVFKCCKKEGCHEGCCKEGMKGCKNGKPGCCMHEGENENPTGPNGHHQFPPKEN